MVTLMTIVGSKFFNGVVVGVVLLIYVAKVPIFIALLAGLDLLFFQWLNRVLCYR